MLPQIIPETDRECLIQLYSAVGEIQNDLARIIKTLNEVPPRCDREAQRLTRLETTREMAETSTAAMLNSADKLDRRLRQIELWQAKLLGAAAGIAALISIATNLGLGLLGR